MNTRTVDVLTTNLGIKIVCKGIPTRRSVAFLQCGQTVGWIKMPLDKDVSLGPGDIALDGDRALPRERGTAGPLLLIRPTAWPQTGQIDRQTTVS